MKTFITVLAFFSIGLTMAKSQSYYKEQWARENTSSLTIGVGSMRSVRGWENGFELNYKTTKGFEIGAFSYADKGTSETPAITYQGLQVALPGLHIGDQMSIGVNVRLGLHQKRFLSFLPTLLLEYNLSEKISVASSIGISDRLPVFAFKLNFRLTQLFR